MNRKGRYRFISVISGAAAFAVFLSYSTTVHAAASITKGAGANVVTPQATGIYSVAILNKDGTKYTTLGLFNKGKLLEAHTDRPGGWLPRKSGKSPKPVSASAFQQLITLAGTNKDVEKMPAATRDKFYKTAGLTGAGSSGSTPLEVPPGPDNKCPFGYEAKIKKPAGGKATVTCQLMSYWLDGASQRFASLWKSSSLVPPAEAKIDLITFHYAIESFGIFRFNFMSDDIGQEVYQFQGFGLTLEWLVGPGG